MLPRILFSAEPAPIIWHLVLPNHYDLDEQYPCIAVLAEPQTSIEEALDQGHGFFHQAGRAGLIVALPIPQVVSVDQKPISHASREGLQLLLEQPTIKADQITLIAFKEFSLRAIERAVEQPDQWPRLALVHPPFTVLPPSPAWDNLSDCSIMMVHPSTEGQPSPWTQQFKALLPEDAHARSMISQSSEPWIALHQLGAEIVKFSVGVWSKKTSRIEFVSLRNRSNRYQWIGDIVRDDASLPARITADFSAETGFEVETQNTASLSLLTPPDADRPFGVRWSVRIDGQDLTLDPGMVWWKLRRRPSGPWSTVPDRTRSASEAEGSAEREPLPEISAASLERVLKDWSESQGIAEDESLNFDFPARFSPSQRPASEPRPSYAMLADQWLDLLEGMTIELQKPNAGAPGVPTVSLKYICSWPLIGSGSAGPALWPLISRQPPTLAVPSVSPGDSAEPATTPATVDPKEWVTR
jgi:hypothetical protein